jgi:8-oxo-dGTP pyrophosphatase MutT (NUDIX family)
MASPVRGLLIGGMGDGIMAVEPVFVRRPGQVDHTHIRYAPVLNAVVVCLGKVLLLQRSSGMRSYPNQWCGISGYLDDHRSTSRNRTARSRSRADRAAQEATPTRLPAAAEGPTARPVAPTDSLSRGQPSGPPSAIRRARFMAMPTGGGSAAAAAPVAVR